jgi:hypothetical protein
LKGLVIYRRRSKINTSVTGGFSKLLSYFIKKCNPSSIMSFVDRRYGSGQYLVNLGFILENEDVSFRWTDGNKTFHRMSFPSNSGYSCKLFKIYDCGQAKYIKTL